jgi:SMC interacting uncharacterized protein involved in chromosome segregation
MNDSLNDSRDQKLDQILAAIKTLDARVEQVETKVDERLRETRPIWEGVQVQLTEIKESVQAETQSRQAQISDVKGQMSEFKESVHVQISEFKESVQGQISELKESQQTLRAEMEKSFRLLDRRMEMYADMVARVHAYERDLEDRVGDLAKRLA